MSPARPEIQRILARPDSKAFNDLRDRAAYVHVTGSHPHHLKTFFKRAVSLVFKMHTRPVSFVDLDGMLSLDDDIVSKLDLSTHPMVLKVGEYKTKGYRVTVLHPSGPAASSAGILMSKGGGRLVVRVDGSILQGWPD